MAGFLTVFPGVGYREARGIRLGEAIDLLAGRAELLDAAEPPEPATRLAPGDLGALTPFARRIEHGV